MTGHAILAAAVVALSAASAFAQSKSSPLPSHLPLRQEACFGRVYDAKHLRSHPQQRVISFHLFRDFAVDANTEYEPDDRRSLLDSDGQYGDITVNAYVRLRDKAGVHTNSLSCNRHSNGIVRCGVDCDGGSFRLKPAGAGLDLANEGFVVVGGCGSGEEETGQVFVEPGTDDRLFRLAPRPLAACVAEREATKPAFAALGAPLRVRLATAEARCFARSYDAAHLAAHPDQQVRRIAVVKPKDETKRDDGDTTHRLTFRVERRDGRIFEKTAECSPDTYLYTCTSPVDVNGSYDFYLARAAGDGILLRDPRKVLAALLGAGLGADDRSFRLTQGSDDACRF